MRLHFPVSILLCDVSSHSRFADSVSLSSGYGNLRCKAMVFIEYAEFPPGLQTGVKNYASAVLAMSSSRRLFHLISFPHVIFCMWYVFELLCFVVYYCFECWIFVLSTSRFLLVFHCGNFFFLLFIFFFFFFFLSKLSQSVCPTIPFFPPRAFCFPLSFWFTQAQLWHRVLTDFSYLKGFCGLAFHVFAGFCERNTTDRETPSCGVSVSVFRYGDILLGRRELNQWYYPCPLDSTHVGDGLVTGLNRASLWRLQSISVRVAALMTPRAWPGT